MATVGLMALGRELTEVLSQALQDEGHTSVWITFGPDAVQLLVRHHVQVLILDAHEYVNAKHLLSDIRSTTKTAWLPIIVLGPARPTQVPEFPGVTKLGRHFDLNVILQQLAACVQSARKASP